MIRTRGLITTECMERQRQLPSLKNGLDSAYQCQPHRSLGAGRPLGAAAPTSQVSLGYGTDRKGTQVLCASCLCQKDITTDAQDPCRVSEIHISHVLGQRKDQ